MIEPLLRFAVARRGLVLALVGVVALFGIWNFQRLNIDAVPDLTNVQVQINTAAEGATPLEVESRVTYPIETALAGLPGLEETRSLSRYGLSQVTAVFRDGSDLYFARGLINERLQSVRATLPQGFEPRLGPVTTGLGEILLYVVAAAPGAQQADGSPWDLTALRGVQDWIVRPQLARVPGVSEINSIGGFEKQFQVSPNPGKLLAFDLGFDEVVQAIRRNNANAGAGYVEKNGEQLLIRSDGQLRGSTDIAQVVVALRNDTPVRVADVATVGIGHPLRSGGATLDNAETVMGTVIMRFGENSRTVARAAASRLAEINRGLPEGVSATVVYDRSVLVDKTITTVRNNLLEGAALVIVVLFLMLGNLRAALITAAVIPLAMLITVSGMVELGISANLMSLGALDFGLIVDGAVIIVENCVRRLGAARAEDGGALDLPSRLKLAYEAAAEVIRPSLFGVLIITLVYVPICAFEGVEGKLFRPMAFTVMLALTAALLLSLSFVPAAVALFLRAPRNGAHRGQVSHAADGLYRRLLAAALRRPLPVLVAALALVVLCAVLATRLGAEFVPSLDEGDIAIEVRRIPGTSLSESLTIQRRLNQAFGQLPEVARVFGGIGTAEVAIDAMPPSQGDTYIMLKPRSQWPDPGKPKTRLVAELEAAAASALGSVYEFSQPVQLRINELISGVRADLAVKVHGDDLEQMQRVGARVAALIGSVPGAADLKLEQTGGLPILTVAPRRDALYRYGLDVDTLQQTLSTAIAGRNAGQIFEGDRRTDIVVRLADSQRSDMRLIERLPLRLPTDAGSNTRPGGYVPLSEVATLVLSEGPAQISRENGKRRVVVTTNVRDRDLAGFVAEVQRTLREKLSLPPGVWLDYGGTYKLLLSANARLMILVPITLAAILALLWLAFGSLRDALLIFSGVPLALTGGVLALMLRGLPFSITAGVGFIALSGVAILNGLVMLTFIHSLRRSGMPLAEALVEGAALRLRPVLMTALVASLGFLPMALNTGLGAEVQRPLATVVIGGILSSTLLTLFVLPLLYRLVHGARHTNFS